MKERKRLITNKCPQCKEFLWPPAQVCGRCNVKAGDEWEELSDKGTVVQFTYVNYPQWDPHKGDYGTEEYPYATILLDDGLYWVSRLEEQDLDKLKKGMRVQAVWKEEGRGRGLDEDILYFRTINE